jgi:Amt family ammonium transporter
VTPLGSVAIGLGVALVCYASVTFLKPALGYDDSLDAFGVHGVGGTWGALASGLFATTFGTGIESKGAQILVRLQSIGFTAVFAPLATFVLLLLLRIVFGSLRADEEAEYEGLDLSQHSETAYLFGTGQ